MPVPQTKSYLLGLLFALCALVTVILSANVETSNAHPFQNAVTSTPDRHQQMYSYWAERRAFISSSVIKKAQAEAAKLPHSGALPPIAHSGTSNRIANAPLPSNNWVQVGPAPVDVKPTQQFASGHFSGRITAIAVDKNNQGYVYIGTAAGGVWKTTDRGSHWTLLTDSYLPLSYGFLEYNR